MSEVLKYWKLQTFDVSGDIWNLKTRMNKKYNGSGSDTTKENIYTYNSLGFRGDSYPFTDNKRVLMTVGCSHTEGVGVNDNETWSFHLSKLLGYNHINFGYTGRSNDYICRVILTYVDIIKPDFVFILYTDPHRSEYYTEDGGVEPYHHNKWGYFLENTDIHNKLISTSNVHNDFINWYKNHLLITYYLKSKDIKWMWDSTFVNTTYTDEHLFGGSLKPFIDYSTDGLHSGPKTNKQYADLIYKNLK